MPKIKSFAPGWLNEPSSPGHKLFEQCADDAKASAIIPYGKRAKSGPRRTIARRGTEVFVAVGKTLRWGDLAYLKESWETKHARSTPGTRIKKEGSEDSPEYDGTIPGHATDGYRVSRSRLAPRGQMRGERQLWG